MRAESSVVRVAIAPDAGTGDGWFWCLESDRALSPAQHYCSSNGVRDVSTGYFTSNGVVSVDNGLLMEGATFYVQLYCPDGCRWQAEVEPTPSPHLSID